MNKITLHTLASDKLYLLAYIKGAKGAIKRRNLVDKILKEGRMNYFFLCQYLSELEDADFIRDVHEMLILTEEGNDALEMFADQMQTTDIASLKTEKVDYRIFQEGDMSVIQKIKDGKTLFSLSCPSDMLPIEDKKDVQTIVENMIEHIKSGCCKKGD